MKKYLKTSSVLLLLLLMGCSAEQSPKTKSGKSAIVHPPQHCRCARVEPKFEEIASLLAKYAEDNGLERFQRPDGNRVVLEKDDEKFSLWYVDTGLYGPQIHSNRRNPDLGKHYEDEIFDLIGSISTLGSCGGLKICDVQTDG